MDLMTTGQLAAITGGRLVGATTTTLGATPVGPDVVISVGCRDRALQRVRGAPVQERPRRREALGEPARADGPARGADPNLAPPVGNPRRNRARARGARRACGSGRVV